MWAKPWGLVRALSQFCRVLIGTSKTRAASAWVSFRSSRHAFNTAANAFFSFLGTRLPMRWQGSALLTRSRGSRVESPGKGTTAGWGPGWEGAILRGEGAWGTFLIVDGGGETGGDREIAEMREMEETGMKRTVPARQELRRGDAARKRLCQKVGRGSRRPPGGRRRKHSSTSSLADNQFVMLSAFLFVAVCFLAYSNGANDNFKGVASLFGSRTCDYRAAISWATVATFAGSVASIFLAQALLKAFSGKGLVPDALTGTPQFLLVVALGAGATVILATLLGFPISTTHSLLGALLGAGLVAVGGQVNFAVLGKAFVMPLLLSPLLAVATGATVYLAARFARLRLGVTKEICICAGIEQQFVPLPQPNSLFTAQALPKLTVTVDNESACTQRYAGTVLGLNACHLLDALHFLSAGAVSFARGLNDTPKIAALLLVAGAVGLRWGLLAVAVAIAVGGLLNAKKVAETMSHRITDMNPGQGLAANLSTALLVTTASLHGLPVSTTHVSVGSLLGMGIVTRQAKWTPMFGVLASWVVTLPCAALIAAVGYLIIRLF